MALPRRIQNSIENQTGRLLREGVPPRERFDTLRLRHIWSTFHATNGEGLAIANNAATGNIPVFRAGKYNLFVVDAGSNGQGLPSGLQLTPLDTNFQGAGRVPDQQNFAIWELGVSVLAQREDVVLASPTTRGAGQPHPDDVARFLSETVLQVRYITQEVPLGHCADYAEPGGPAIVQPSLLDYSGNAVAAAGPPAGGVGGLSAGAIAAQPWSLQQPRLQTNGGNGNANPGSRIKLDVPIFLPSSTQFAFQLYVTRPFALRSLENGGTAGFKVRVDLWVAESYRPNS